MISAIATPHARRVMTEYEGGENGSRSAYSNASASAAGGWTNS